MIDVLVVGSHPAELRGLRQTLGERLDGRLQGIHVSAKTVGIGLANAAASTAKRLFQLEPRAVIHLGTCGIYPGATQYQPHDVLVAQKVHLLDHAAEAQRAAIPDPMSVEHSVDGTLMAGLTATHRARPAPIASPLANTTDDQLAASVLQRRGYHAESLEAFGVAQACRLAQTPFAGVYGVTHVVGSNAQVDWQQFQRQSSLTAAEVLLAWVHAGAPGVPLRG
tara:strand:+ start:365 stop:1033 length:669 start_codon:yes stop_codon:yes gene_type:complete